MWFGILQRYVMGQVLRTFVLALTTITIIFSLFVVMAEATRLGLAPQEVMALIPYLLPGSLPYTMPVAMLFSVTIVYGRIAGDNEIMAIKAAGLNALRVLLPAVALAGLLSAGLLVLSGELIPRANNTFRRIIMGSIEDNLYRFLKKERVIDNPKMPFYIQVRDVEDRTLIEPVFKHRASPANPASPFDLVVRARTAQIKIDIDNLLATIELEDAESDDQRFLFWVNGKQVLQYPIPKPQGGPEPRVQEMTNGEMSEQQVELRRKIARERQRQAASAVLRIAAGRIDQVEWKQIRDAHFQYDYWFRKYNELETEKHLRIALASGVLFFVLVGAPVGILFARRDFLSAFITCFVPILIIYYPLILVGMNLGKEGVLPPYVVFGGNFVLGALAGVCIYPIHKH